MYGLYVTYLQKRYCFRCSCIYSTLKCSSILVCFNELRDRITVHHTSKLNYFERVNIALSSCSSFATVRDFRFNPSLVSMLSVNFRTFSLFLHISEVSCLLIFNSSAKFVPFSPFSRHEIIICLSFIKRLDCCRFIDVAVI